MCRQGHVRALVRLCVRVCTRGLDGVGALASVISLGVQIGRAGARVDLVVRDALPRRAAGGAEPVHRHGYEYAYRNVQVETGAALHLGERRISSQERMAPRVKGNTGTEAAAAAEAFREI